MLNNVVEVPTFIKLALPVAKRVFINMTSRLSNNLVNGSPKMSRKLEKNKINTSKRVKNQGDAYRVL